uniref:ATP synthase F0 subunit 8 n=1 Tax=Siobla xizangensis TaxID=2651042 RepID=A0A649WEB5_9HYME|nr:ATP synthase F0 subunit 8 [Siobla xizangensis]
MPQMFPMYWIILFIYFLMIFLFFNIMNYFIMMNLKILHVKKMCFLKNFKKKNLWKW